MNKILKWSLLTLIALVICSCNTTKQMEEKEAVVPFNNKIMVTLKKGVAAEDLVTRYKEYALKYRGLTSKTSNKVMFEFDDSLISNGKMIALLRKDKQVVTAENLKKASKKSTAPKSTSKGTSIDPTK